MTFETKLALFAGAIPGLLALAAFALAWRRRPHAPDAPTPRALAALAPVLLLLAFLAADYAVNGLPRFWPGNASFRYPHAVGLIACVGLIDALARPPWWVLAPLRAGAVSGAVWILGAPYVPHAVTRADFIGWTIAAALAGAAGMGAAERGAGALRAPGTPLLLLGLVLGTGAIVAVNNLAYAAMSSIGPAAVLGAAAMAGLFRKSLSFERGGAATAAGIAIIVVASSIFQTEVHSVPAAILLGAAPLALGCTHLARARGAWARFLAGAAALLVCLSAAAAPAFLASPEFGPPPEDADDEYADYAAP